MSHSQVSNHARSRPARWLHAATWIFSLAVCAVALWILHRYLTNIAWRDVAAAWSRMPVVRIVGSLVAAGVGLSMLGLFDVLAARTVVPGRVSTGMAAFAGTVTNAIANTLGFHAVTGSAVRYRIYRAVGLGVGDIARIISLAGLGVGLGFVVTITAALCWQPEITRGWGRFPGVALALLLAGLLVWLARRPRTFVLWRWTLVFPAAGTASAQMLVGAVEMSAAISALYVLLPAGVAPPFIDFLPIYVGAVVAGIISHSPGGLGVFETIMLASFPGIARPELLAALICYRVTYNLLPFVLGCAALGVFEFRQRRRRHAAEGNSA